MATVAWSMHLASSVITSTIFAMIRNLLLHFQIIFLSANLSTWFRILWLPKNLSSKKIFAELKGEFDEMKELTKLIRLEVLHFSKHTLWGCWQETAEKELHKLMWFNPEIKRVKADHKNKTLAQKLFEPTSDFFPKHGISNFGAQIYWWGRTRKGKRGCTVGSPI